MKAASIVKPKLLVQDLDIPNAKGSEIVIKVLSSGICHGDIHLWEGGYEGIGDNFLRLVIEV
jgi:propanol-preferring alcohol dehydrogenase